MTQLKTKTDIPVNIYRPKNPLTNRCLFNQKLVQEKAVGDVLMGLEIVFASITPLAASR